LRHRGFDGGGSGIEGGKQFLFRISVRELGVGPVGVFDAVLFLGLREDVVGALKPLDQVLTVVGVQRRLQGSGAFDQKGQVVGLRHGKAGVNHVVPDALILEVDLEAVVEEGEEVLL